MLIEPLSGTSNPAINLKTTVLPHPEGPTIVKHSPEFTSKLKSFHPHTHLIFV